MRTFSTLVGLPLVGVLCVGAPISDAAEQEPAVSMPEDAGSPVTVVEQRLAPVSTEMERSAAVAGTANAQIPPMSSVSLTSVSSNGDRLLTTVRVGVLASQVMDLSTTAYGIGTGTVKEANPFMRWAADEPLALASMKLGTAAGLDWTIRKLSKSGHRKTAIILGVALTAASMAVSIHNMNEIRSAQR
ncbi:MAG: DUF5658 family protein [Vicinamibacteraceae bacterium]